ncbi:HAMP domain-containing sensor histidine kinase [Streptomyces sp. NPDC048161]|uniref:sensor histidine kinase n=1 Tax=unclassified Streptomyces TaxID=2593676 RepID=UPI00081B26F4|nr:MULTISPECIES: HAMP domain-containing sensor histidine kinase [unclassified Streptomyces]MYQ89518.1 HAMP domain-containing protein [Streptomyces sp. SID4936]SCE58739.1 Signal transduction histidine kinase [Streptomyces sp. DvalAA-43]
MGKPWGGTVRRRFTILYAGGFLGSGTVLLALIYLMSGTRVTTLAPEGIPGQVPEQVPAGRSDLASAEQRIRDLGRQLSEVHAQQNHRLLVGSLIALAVMAGVSLLLGRILADRVLRPLRLITAATRRISAENLYQRLAVAGPVDEVKELADTVDGLLERLEVSFVAQRRFVGNASHELRTPLATMRASLDVAVAKPEPAAQTVALAGRLRAELDRVDHLLDGFLVLARAQHGTLADRTPVSLGELARRALAARTADIAAKALTVDDEVRANVRTEGSEALLFRMVENMVDNAIVHNQESGWVRISTEHTATEARLVVETGGRIFDQDQVDRLTQPFERLGTDRTGPEGSSGLGLSIVAAIVAAHDGRLALQARPEGGLRVVAALPSAARSDGVTP